MVLTNRRSIYISIQRLHYFDCVSIHFTLWYQQRPKILYTIGMYHSVFTLIVQWKRRRFTAIHSFGNPLRPTKYLVHTLIRKTNEINTSRREYHHPFGLYGATDAKRSRIWTSRDREQWDLSDLLYAKRRSATRRPNTRRRCVCVRVCG